MYKKERVCHVFCFLLLGESNLSNEGSEASLCGADGCSWLEQVQLELPTLFQVMKILKKKKKSESMNMDLLFSLIVMPSLAIKLGNFIFM